jgi:predicted dehydrogenase
MEAAAVAEPIGVGIIGTGIHGARYARHILAEIPELRLIALSRRSPAGAEQARKWGCRHWPRWEDLVADPRVEAVIAAATPDLNPAIAAACARAAKPLLVEKPLAASVAAGEAMLADFARAGLPLTVAQTLRYNSVILALRDALPRAGQLHGFSANQRLERSTHPWLEDPAVAGGGVILHTAVHLLDALRFVTGREIVRVRAWTARRYNPRLEDHFLGLVEMDDGLLGSVDASKVGPARAGRYEFVGDEGQLQGGQIHGSLDFVTGAETRPLRVAPLAPTLPLLLRDWQVCLRGAGPNPIPGEAGLAALRACEACARSAATGEELRL